MDSEWDGGDLALMRNLVFYWPLWRILIRYSGVNIKNDIKKKNPNKYNNEEKDSGFKRDLRIFTFS